MAEDEKLLNQVAEYYEGRLAEYGMTPRGVDWNGEESQVIRFAQLSKIIDGKNKFSINDLGCGYGAIVKYFVRIFGAGAFEYRGYDVSPEMVAAAHKFSCEANATFAVGAEPDRIADYGLASGIFNVRLQNEDAGWMEYVLKTLDCLSATSRKGFSFNCLTSYSDEDKKRSYLYYADPCCLFDYCKRKFSRNVAVLHDYGLYEFTILVRK